MCNENNFTTNNDCECLTDILKVIIRLQNREEEKEDNEGCDKPFLGPCPSKSRFNTRPIQFYTCCSGELWEFPISRIETDGPTSNVFRVENVDDCCCTCRVLAPNPDKSQCDTPFVATDSFFTINLNCVGALKCLRDTFVPCI